MTLEERIVMANSEMKKIGLWFNAERKKIYAELNTKLGANRKFNDGNENYTGMYEELARRCLEVQKNMTYHPTRS